jgi:membrane peptidoglycan carboxypeptidase
MPSFINYPRKDKKGFRRFIPSWKLTLGTAFFVGLFGSLSLAYLVSITAIPSPNQISVANATIVYYADGKREIGRIGEYNRVQVDLAQIPLNVQHAVLALEDRDFYNHSGFSITGIGRAVVNNLVGGSQQGGSTITQQYVKNVYLTSERSITRKVKELVLAIKLETSSDKDTIFENYLNTVYFGRGAYGIEAAAQAYFSKRVSELSISESAFLASLLKSPEGLAPEVDLPSLKNRWGDALDAMVIAGWLASGERAKIEFPIYIERIDGNRLAGTKGYILAEVSKRLNTLGYDDAALGVAGLRVVTTIEKRAQKSAERAVLRLGPKTNIEGVRIGLIAERPGTGEIIAMYGGPDYVTQPYNNVTQSTAQAGSTFKLFGLLAAIENGYSLDYVLPGKSKLVINGYEVNNYSGEKFKNLSLLQATIHSVNTAYVKLTYDVGVGSLIDIANRSGISSELTDPNYDLTFVLGSTSPTAADLVEAYATVAAQGMHAEGWLLKEVTSPNGGLIYQGAPQVSNAYSAEVAATAIYALRQVVVQGTGVAAGVAGREVAGKTGTSSNNLSAWFCGFTPQIAATVMMSKQDENGNPISLNGTGGLGSVTGGSFPARIFSAFMNGALKNEPKVKFPTTTASPTSTVLPTETSTPTPTETPTESASETATSTETATETP